MLKRLSQREQIANLLDQFSLAIRQAFLDAIDDIRSRLTLSLIITRLEKGDIAGAADAIGIERSAFNPVLDKIAEAYNAGGTAATDGMPILREPGGAKLIVRFDSRNLRAESWLRNHSAQLVTNIVEDQRQAVRSALTAGLAGGRNPRQTTLDIVGRVERASGRRAGGIIGLTAQQSSAVAIARQSLVSGDPESMRGYFTRTRRDRRFDRTVRAAIEAGKPVPQEMATKIVGRYADGLLQLRGETIARTETLTALNGAAAEAMQQAVDDGKVQQSVITSVWHTRLDGRERETHAAMNGQTVPFGQMFQSPSGARLRFPGDPAAPVSEIANCRCWAEHKIDFLAGIR